MCGIAGILQLDGQEASTRHLAAMIAQIAHRGPDASEVWGDGPVGLAHARLSIIDLANGRQPMHAADGELTVTFNGEIFNYVELRDELTRRGHRFRTHSDTEVILRAYLEYGERCVEHFNGQWAFAIWDRRRRRLFLSRDRLGIRPLFYTKAGGRFLFASETKSLFAHPNVHRELDPKGMNQIFTFWSTLAPATAFSNIQQLPPGHNLVVRDGQMGQPEAYWQLDYTTDDDNGASADQWAERLRELLEDATRLRLRADVPVGAYLSGGLDSSVTAALARQATGDRLRTFSIAFDDREFDESAYQQQVVDFLGVEHHAIGCSHDAIARVFPDVVWHAEKPVLRTAPAPLHLLSRLVRELGLKVVLTGEGADEMLGGYDLFKEAKVRRFLARGPESPMRGLLIEQLYPYQAKMQAQSVAMRKAFFNTTPDDLASPFFSHFPRWRMTAQLKRFFSPDFLPPEMHGQPLADVEAALPADFPKWKPFCQAQYLETAILMPGYILSSQGDRAAMANSVEARFPFLDHRLAEFAARMPVRLKMQGLCEKYLLKRAARDIVPPAVLARPKQPYRAPDAKSFFSDDWQQARQEYVDRLLSPERIAADGVFQSQAVEQLVRKVRAGKATGVRDNMALVGVLSTQLLIDQMIHRNSTRTSEPATVPVITQPIADSIPTTSPMT